MKKTRYFTIYELCLWLFSVLAVVITFFAFKSENYLNLIGSCIGISSLIFVAKGNPIGHILGIIFSVFYGVVSYTFRYYGEMITYLLMTAPMSVIALISWLKNPFNGNKAQVKVSKVTKKDWCKALLLTAVVTIAFYFILKALDTANIVPSTISVATSFLAVYFSFKRSRFYALSYALNDIVLIVLWILASIENTSYASIVACFAVFLVNDLYGFINWKRMSIAQSEENSEKNKRED